MHKWRKVSEKVINYPLGIVEVVYRCTCGCVHVQRERRKVKGERRQCQAN